MKQRGERERERERESVRERERERECEREERERDRAREILYSYVIRVQRTSVARVGVFPSQLGYFESTVTGKMTEPWVAFFWATYIMYRGRPKCM